MMNRRTIVAIVLLLILAAVLFMPKMSYFAGSTTGIQKKSKSR